MANIKKRINKGGTVWQVDYYDPEGRRVRKDFDLKKEAEAYLGKVVAAKKERRYHDVFDVKKETQVTFNELAERYEENFKTQKSFDGSKRYLLGIVKDHFGEKRLSDISYLDLETYRNIRKSIPVRGENPRTDASVNREMALISHMLSKSVEWDILEVSPFTKGKRLMFKENNQRLRFLTNDEIIKLLDACPLHLGHIVEVAIHTGMRRGELLSLKWEQIRNGFIYLTITKSGKPRQVPINDTLATLFQVIRKEQKVGMEYVFIYSRKNKRKKEAVGSAADVLNVVEGNPVSSLKTSFSSALRRAGIQDFKFHDLRHTFASQLVMNGVNLKAVQELLGHADIKMTMRYAHLSQDHLQDAVAVLNKLGNGRKMDTDLLENEKRANHY